MTIDDTPDNPQPPAGTTATAPPAAATPLFRTDRDDPWPALAVFAAAIVGHLPLLGAWWCRDDWGLLAGAAGLLEGRSGMPVRWLSQHLYWQVTWPLWGLDAAPHAWVRLALHGLSALLVVRLGRRGGLTPAAAALAGFVFGASPLAFTPLYWAAGIQELLAAALALLAVDRWLAAGRQGRCALLAAMLAGLGALAAKESALGLGLLLGALAWTDAGGRRGDRRAAWAAIAILLTAAVGAGWLAVNRFDTGAGGPYETGGLATLAANLGFCGRWLPMPGPIIGISPTWLAAAIGGLVLTGWAAWGAWRWRRRERLPLAALFGALLSLAPVLPLRHHLAPYMAYLAVAGWALTLGTLIPRRLPLPRLALVAAMIVFSVWGLFSSRAVLSRRNELGLPADDIVRATSLSWEAAGLLRNLGSLGGDRPVRQVVLLQFPAGPGALEFAGRYGERWAGRTDLYEALAGELGPRLLVAPGIAVQWRNGLVTAPDSALVLVETGTGLRPWGRTGQAALYAALTDIGLGNFERGRGHLVRAGSLGGKDIGFACDEGLLPIPLALVTGQREAFIDWTVGLLGRSASRAEVGGLQDIYLNLLCACTGRSVDELSRGSRILLPANGAAAPDPQR